MCELNRIASHLLFFGTYGIDTGAFTPFLYAFREREMVLDLFEMVCGARLTYNYIRLGGVMTDATLEWTGRLKEFLEYQAAWTSTTLSPTYNPIFHGAHQGRAASRPRTRSTGACRARNLRGSA